MTPKNIPSSAKGKPNFFPKLTVITAVCVTSAVFCVMIVVAVFGYSYISTNQKKLHKLQKAYHEIIANDETRTTSLLLAVTQNDYKYKQEYDTLKTRAYLGISSLQPLLEIQQERDVLNAVRDSISRLCAIEENIFSLVKQGRHADADNLLIGGLYKSALATYYTNIGSLTSLITKQIDEETKKGETSSLLAAVFIVVLSPVITLLWILIFVLYVKKKKQYEKAHLEFEKVQSQYKNLLEFSNDGVIVLQDGLVKYWNKKLYEVFEYKPEDVISKPFINFVAPEYRKLVAERYAARLAGKDVVPQYEMEILSKRGEHIPIFAHVSLSVYEDRPATMVVVEDMRQEKRLEQMKYDFVSIASHQLRTPLTGVKWFSELLLGTKRKNLTRPQRDYIRNIYESNQRMIGLVDDLLDVSHIQEGAKFPIVPRLENMASLAHEAILRQTLSAKRKKIKIKCLTKKSERVMMHVDKEKIMQVFQNFLGNAIKYSPAGSIVEVGCTPKKGEIVFFVKDHGVGIPTGEQSRVFEKFFRGTNVKTTETGTGLGLYIVKAIIEGHGGRLWFESKENKGSTFYFSLPIIS